MPLFSVHGHHAPHGRDPCPAARRLPAPVMIHPCQLVRDRLACGIWPEPSRLSCVLSVQPWRFSFPFRIPPPCEQACRLWPPARRSWNPCTPFPLLSSPLAPRPAAGEARKPRPVKIAEIRSRGAAGGRGCIGSPVRAPPAAAVVAGLGRRKRTPGSGVWGQERGFVARWRKWGVEGRACGLSWWRVVGVGSSPPAVRLGYQSGRGSCTSSGEGGGLRGRAGGFPGAWSGNLAPGPCGAAAGLARQLQLVKLGAAWWGGRMGSPPCPREQRGGISCRSMHHLKATPQSGPKRSKKLDSRPPGAAAARSKCFGAWSWCLPNFPPGHLRRGVGSASRRSPPRSQIFRFWAILQK